MANTYHSGIKTSLRYTVLVLLLAWMTAVSAAGIDIGKAETKLVDGVYQLNADIYYTLSDEVLEALESGVLITMRVSVKIERVREYFWNETIDEQLHHYQLQYHALSGQYLVAHFDSTEQQSYLSLTSALRAVGSIRNLTLVDKNAVKEGEIYLVKLNSELDTNALPAPLRPMAWLSSEWQLRSEWVTCPLRS